MMASCLLPTVCKSRAMRCTVDVRAVKLSSEECIVPTREGVLCIWVAPGRLLLKSVPQGRGAGFGVRGKVSAVVWNRTRIVGKRSGTTRRSDAHILPAQVEVPRQQRHECFIPRRIGLGLSRVFSKDSRSFSVRGFPCVLLVRLC